VPGGSSLSIANSSFTGHGGHGVQTGGGSHVLNNLTITGNSGDGLRLYGSDDSQLLGSRLQNNTGDGIHTDSADRLTLDGLTISGNGGYGIEMNSRGAGSVLRNSSVQGNDVWRVLGPRGGSAMVP
jgi:parallel beta-helix repeat protein